MGNWRTHRKLNLGMLLFVSQWTYDMNREFDDEKESASIE